MILSALFMLAVVVEVFLLLGKDYLLDTRRRAALEVSLRQAYAELLEARARVEARRAELLAAIDAADDQRAELNEADEAFARSQRILPNLVHVLGDRNSGIRFRAPISKMLPATPDPAQQLIWSCKNFVDVWAGDIQAARELVLNQFRIKHDYDIGELTAMPPPDMGAAHEKAA